MGTRLCQRQSKHAATGWAQNSVEVDVQAVLYSFRQACVGMVDHHTLLQGFWEWYWKEKRTRGYVPGNWKWSVPDIHYVLIHIQSSCIH
jgi:nitric oxide synthase oxygenase domain/subunit